MNFDIILEEISKEISYDIHEEFYDFQKWLKHNRGNKEICKSLIHDFILEVENDSMVFCDDNSKQKILKILDDINI